MRVLDNSESGIGSDGNKNYTIIDEALILILKVSKKLFLRRNMKSYHFAIMGHFAGIIVIFIIHLHDQSAIKWRTCLKQLNA